MDKQTVLITGASGGIGKELAVHFARDGYQLVLVARDSVKLANLKKELESSYQSTVYTIVKDISKQEAVTDVYEWLQQQNISIDYLVNNAGFGLFGEFVNTNMDEELNMIDLNIRSLTQLTKLFLPSMTANNRGGILNVASMAAFQPGPLMAVYYATKAYVLSFTEALANELKETNIKVTALCPGATETGFSNRANLHDSKLFKSGVMDVQEVAAAGYKGFHSGKTIIIPGAKNKVLASSVRLVPRKTVTSIVRHMQAREK